LPYIVNSIGGCEERKKERGSTSKKPFRAYYLDQQLRASRAGMMYDSKERISVSECTRIKVED
jgi:hypothetical protein